MYKKVRSKEIYAATIIYAAFLIPDGASVIDGTADGDEVEPSLPSPINV